VFLSANFRRHDWMTLGRDGEQEKSGIPSLHIKGIMKPLKEQMCVW